MKKEKEKAKSFKKEKQQKHGVAFYWKLFYSTLSLSAFTIGGGYVIIPLMKKKFVDNYGWITEEEMLNYVAIGQSAPGVIAINVSILVGFGVAGAFGALLTILGTTLPPMIIIGVVSYFYEALHDNMIFRAVMFGLQCAVAAVIVDAVITMAINIIKTKDLLSIFIMCACLAAAIVFDVNIMFILLVCICLGVGIALVKHIKSHRTPR